MKSRKLTLWTLGLMALACTASIAATGLPYTQSFESGFALGDPWTAEGDGTVSAIPAAALPGAGSQGLSISDAVATLDVTDSELYDNVWIQIYAKPVPGDDDPPDPSDVSGAFYVTTEGDLMAWSPGGWVPVKSGLTTSDYMGFVVHADYGNDTWDIYYTPGTTGNKLTNALERANSDPLQMIGSPTTLDFVSIQSGEEAYVDAIAVSKGFTDVGASGDKLAVEAFNAADTALRQFVLPVYAGRYTSPASAKTLDGAVGNDIRTGFVNGDEVHVWDPDAGGFGQYVMQGGVLVRDDGDTLGAPLPGDINVEATTALLVDQLDSGRSDTFGFFPYSNATAISVGAVEQPGAGGHSESIVLNGTGRGNQGYTGLEWPRIDTIVSLPFNSNTHLQNGDRLYIADGDSNAYLEYWWQAQLPAGPGRWMYWAAVASRNLPGNARMWVRRQAGADTGQIDFDYTVIP